MIDLLLDVATVLSGVILFTILLVAFVDRR